MNLDGRFIPLFFGDDDEDLWNALQRIKPEERANFIKCALRNGLNFLSLANDFSLTEFTPASTSVANSESSSESTTEPDPAKSREEQQTAEISLRLEGLFVPSTPNDMDISEEEEEKVADVKGKGDEKEEPGLKTANADDALSGLGINSIADLFIPEPNQPTSVSPESLRGLQYLLNNIIGTEDDEEVINVLRKKDRP